ncbi:MAG: hypothetical protein KNN16_02940 [Thermoflexus hugenholtzii]|uniref:hypothetical protein n=1 Tax=Thermoflexus TaxID=1495649 RepID=UPI001C782417|nr:MULTISPECIES: hypothetical protein [Thermoflexus]QWK11242.1 MAG: hypothetical protein KNN16_02940 [Thermoflexus hugenholtzii]
MILLDTTVLSNFARIGRLDLLRAVLSNAATTPYVIDELKAGEVSGYLFDCDWEWLEIVKLSPTEEDHLTRIRRILGEGEASCIAVALERGGILFTDDGDARRYALRLGIPVSGTLGVLALLVKKGYLTLSGRLLDEDDQSRLPVAGEERVRDPGFPIVPGIRDRPVARRS